MIPTIPPLERFRLKYIITDTGCWFWTGTVSTARGYARIAIKSRPVDAHRWAYEQFVGPIPEGLELDHLCHTRDLACPGGRSCPHRRCVNPEHLEPVTPQENGLRGRGSAWINATKTHCPQGHEYTEANTYLHKGKRNCRRCNADAAARLKARKQAQP